MYSKRLFTTFLAVLLIAIYYAPITHAAYALFDVGGDFTNTVFSFGVQGAVNGCDAGTEWTGQQGKQFANYGASGCTATPSTSTQHETGGNLGVVTNASTTTNAVGMTGYALASGNGVNGNADANRVRLWGFNSLQADRGYAHVLFNNEMDYNITGTDTKVVGFFSAGVSTHQPAAGSVWMNAGPIGNGIRWPVAYQCADAASDLCVQIGLNDPTVTATPSQKIRIISRTSGGVINFDDIYLDTNGDLIVTPAGGSSMSLKKNGRILAKGYDTY